MPKSSSTDDDPPPFGLSRLAWANLDASVKAIGLLPLAIGAVFYLWETPNRDAASVYQAWRALTDRPKVPELDIHDSPVWVPARSWGARPALEALVHRKERLNSIELGGADLSKAQLATGNFGWAGFRGANFWEADLRNADFTCADLRSVNFGKARLAGTRFEGANVGGASFVDADPNDIRRIVATACISPGYKGYGITIDPPLKDLDKLPLCAEEDGKPLNDAKPLGRNC